MPAASFKTVFNPSKKKYVDTSQHSGDNAKKTCNAPGRIILFSYICFYKNIKLTKLQCEIWENGDIAATKCDEAGNMRSQ